MRLFIERLRDVNFPFHWERGPNGTVQDGGSGRCGPLFRGAWNGFREGDSGRGLRRCQEASVMGQERCFVGAARVLAAVSCFFVLTKGMREGGPITAILSDIERASR